MLDDVDRQIIRCLQEDGRMALTDIAVRLRMAEGTIRKRLARLVQEKVIRLTAVVDPLRTGRRTLALVGVKVDADRGPGIAEALAKLPEVRYLAFSSGEHDLLLQVAVESNEELFRFLTERLRGFEGVKSSDSSLILRTVKESESWFAG